MKYLPRALQPLIAAAALATSCFATETSFIVQLTPGQHATALAEGYGMNLLSSAPGDAPFALYSVDADSVDDVEANLMFDPGVQYVGPNFHFSMVGPVTQSRGGTLPVLAAVGELDSENSSALAQIGWDSSVRSLDLRSVRVAILDTGISPNATDLMSRVVVNEVHVPSFNPMQAANYDLPDNRFPIADWHNEAVGHGTMVASLIAEVAPNADLVIEKVADSSGQASTWSVICGLAGAVENHAEVANISLGTASEMPALEMVIDWAEAQGVVVVASAGNDSDPSLLQPASYSGVIAVAGVDDSDAKADFSNWSPAVVTSAPSVEIRGAYWDGYTAVWSGTSVAAPFVSGALALKAGTVDSLSVDTVAQQLYSSGDSIDDLNPDYAGQLGTRLDIAHLLSSDILALGTRPRYFR